MKKIIIDVPLKGIARGQATPAIKTQGFVGQECKNASKFLEQALGTVVSDTPTNEMYATEAIQQTLADGQ